jgi:hypothetical protein
LPHRVETEEGREPYDEVLDHYKKIRRELDKICSFANIVGDPLNYKEGFDKYLKLLVERKTRQKNMARVSPSQMDAITSEAETSVHAVIERELLRCVEDGALRLQYR